MLKLLSKNKFTVPAAIAALICCLTAAACSPGAETGTTLPYGQAIYASSSGCDTNTGLYPEYPLQSLKKAAAVAAAYEIPNLLVNGDYVLSTNSSSMNSGLLLYEVSSLKISGGWNSGFTAQDDISILKGDGSCIIIVYLYLADRIVIENFVITGATNASGGAGGIFAAGFYNGSINCIVSNNHSTGNGGGITILGSNNTVAGTVANNSAYDYSGGISLLNSANNVVTAYIDGNTTLGSGGGIYIKGSNNTVSGTITGNTAAGYGGGIMLDGATNTTIASSAVIRYNRCDAGGMGSAFGGGIFGQNSTGTALSGTYTPNFSGAGFTTTNDLAGVY